MTHLNLQDAAKTLGVDAEWLRSRVLEVDPLGMGIEQRGDEFFFSARAIASYRRYITGWKEGERRRRGANYSGRWDWEPAA